MEKESKEWRKLTFSQREGKAPLPEPLQAGKLSKDFKNRIWFIIGTHITNCSHKLGDYFVKNEDGYFWEMFIFSYHANILKIPYDEVVKRPDKVREWVREMIFKKESHEIITFLECMLRLPSIPKYLSNNIENFFKFAPYFIDRSDTPVAIIPSTSEEAKESSKKSLDNINQSKLTGAKSHLQKAAQELNAQNFSNSMRESIHAVASAARQIDPKASKDLSPALNSLEKHGILKHPALKEAFKKLYGYTSDEKGIRKPLVSKKSADVGFDEAIFMYGVCVTFVDYLVSKQRQLSKK